MTANTALRSSILTNWAKEALRDLQPVEDATALELLTITLLRALEELGSAGGRLARKAGERHGRQLAGGRVRTIEEALAPLRQIGIEYEVRGHSMVATLVNFRDSKIGPSPVVSCLQAGMIQGLLDGAGLSYTVRRIGGRNAWEFRYRICRRPLA